MEQKNTKQEIKNYGLKFDKPDKNAYFLGGQTKLKKDILKVNKNWEKYLPTYEPQSTSNFDSFGCTIWATLNILEILIKRIEGIEYNFSDRFSYILAGIRPPGADPHNVAEVIRKTGVINEELLPFTETYEEFIKPFPMTADLLFEGLEFPYEIKHEFVWRTPQTKEQRIKKIREGLKFSPLGVAVTAWYEENGVYVDKGQRNTHFVALYKEVKNGWLIFDSYDKSIKTVSFDHNISVCKRYSLTKKGLKDNSIKDIFNQFINFLKNILSKLSTLLN